MTEEEEGVKQSDSRTPGRNQGGSAWSPRVDEVDEPGEEFPVLGGQPFTVVMPVRVVPDQEYLEALYLSVKEVVYRAFLDGTTEAMQDVAGDGDEVAEPVAGEEEQSVAGGGLSPE